MKESVSDSLARCFHRANHLLCVSEQLDVRSNEIFQLSQYFVSEYCLSLNVYLIFFTFVERGEFEKCVVIFLQRQYE